LGNVTLIESLEQNVGEPTGNACRRRFALCTSRRITARSTGMSAMKYGAEMAVALI